MQWADAMEDSSALFDLDTAWAVSAEDDSMSIDSFMKILDEGRASPLPQLALSSGTPDGLHQGKLVPGQVNFGKVFHHSDYWLRLSSSEDNPCLMNSVGGSSDGLITNNFDYQQLENNIPKCSASPESAEGAGLLYSPCSDIANGLYLDSGEENDCVQMGGETSFQPGVKESISDVNYNSSAFMLQNGGIDSSHIMLMENSGFSGRVHVDMNASAVPDSTVQEGNLCAALSMSSSMDPDIILPDTIHAVVNTSEATYAMCNASGSCLTLPRVSPIDTETASRQILPGQCFQPFLSCEKEAIIHRKHDGEDQRLLLQNSCMTSKVELVTQEEFLDTSMPEVSVIDLDSPFPGVLFAEQNRCEDMSFNSESSSDSSPVPSSRNSTSFNLDKDKRVDQIPASRHKQHNFPKSSNDPVQWNPSRNSLSVDDDADICILDDISDPAHPPTLPVNMKLQPMSQQSGFSDLHYHGSGGMRLKADDERLTLQIALQDLSQTKTEASPPDGVLAVPLLRHQRIALSWMVQKETNSLHCSGGILADDQGLGKTISTIALILMERSPSRRSCSVLQKPDELEALNLDDDDDGNGISELIVMKQPRNSSPVMMNLPIKRENSVMVVKGRPAAGTLVVCPTSVLRQWADELQNKVTSKANLSFLVYHGSNRTKDPNELTKYDVVLTTYAIVSMEVPKQPLVDKDDEERGKVDASALPSGLLTSKKRKNSSNSNMKNQDSVLLESAARPLARVGWFRVILDEAQSIKNYRTQVARACWGLRAKRRWCLSGTPIQNAVDDLYSYFRFLRYDPYAVYKSFCTRIKLPISRNPTDGYKKLQAVLKTIMLRRTKGTLIDGKPIINLPPRTVTMKKVDFSEEERAFYATLEAESQEQFKEYAAAGTVKQNYVNILLMLLRLRQACDHPLLVKGYGSNSIGRFSMDIAKKLPRDKQIELLSCLEACLAICTICNDPPEDAVVTICGHVFCNQCIHEHLTGDDNICPSAHCKVRLTVASVFSRGTLKSCLSGLPDHDCPSGTSVPYMVNAPKMCEESLSSDSSKIKAALEILRSLPRSQCSSSRTNLEKSNGRSVLSLENAVNTASAIYSMDISDRKYSDSDKPSNSQATEKAIVFSQWTRMLNLLEIPLKDSCIQYRRLDGTMSVAARDKAVKDFNTLPEVTVMIMSLKAASLGLNMVAACHVLLLDLWWNPTTEDQAIDRAHRIGQTRPVTVSRLTVRDTVEDRILALQEKKREMVASAFGEDESGARQSRLTVEDLEYLFMV